MNMKILPSERPVPTSNLVKLGKARMLTKASFTGSSAEVIVDRLYDVGG